MEKGKPNLYGFVLNRPAGDVDPYGKDNWSGSGGQNTVGIITIIRSSIPGTRSGGIVYEPESEFLAWFAGFKDGIGEFFKDPYYRGCQLMCSWDQAANAVFNPTPWDITMFQGLGGYGNGPWVEKPDIGGGLQALGDIAEAEAGAKFDALGGNAKLQRLRDWLSRPGCGP